MKKETINVPYGVKYLSEIDGFELPNGILNKVIPDCGGTTLALEDKHRTIICSPRNNLIENKHRQHGSTLLVIGGCREADIIEYIEQTDVPKILTSYDSLGKVARCIADKSDWRVVADEFQYLLSDSSFKSKTELCFMETLKSFDYVTYLSATPILDRYINRINYFKDVPYTELVWPDVEKVKVIRQRSPRPIDAAIKIVRLYKDGVFPSTEQNGNTVYSEECVIYLNSVNNILNIIKQTGLSADEVNIIVGNSENNRADIAKLGKGFEIGTIPLKDERHKTFTFCTSTAFAGCDFYSTNATSFVISDSKRVNTMIDISTDLVQIAGRQRLGENPFRRYLFFIYNFSKSDKTEQEFEMELEKKRQLTEDEIKHNNQLSDGALRDKRIKDVCRLQKMLKYSESFTIYDEGKGRFVFDEMALISERYSYDLQRYNYENGIAVKRQLADKFDVSTPQGYNVYEEQLENLIRKESFAERMKRYCDSRNSKFDMLSMFLERMHPELKSFYEELGGERIKALGYKECALKNEVLKRDKRSKLRAEFVSLFSGRSLSADYIKAAMNEVYARFGVKGNGKVADLSILYGLTVKRTRPVAADGNREYMYEIG